MTRSNLQLLSYNEGYKLHPGIRAVSIFRARRRSFMAKAENCVTHNHVDVLGVSVSAINMRSAVSFMDQWIRSGQRGYVCVTGVHGVMEAQKDSGFLEILNAAALNTPDGMPLSWIGWLQGHKAMDRVYGPDLLLEVCRHSVECGYRHFFYGGQEGVAQQLAKNLQERFRGLQIAGTYTPPFRPLNAEEEADLIGQIDETKPHVLWVGLSTPKQERFMAQYSGRMNVGLMVGVGAAFDMHTGRAKDAPQWMKRTGLQWFHRLCQEPKRLSHRYFVNNPVFVAKIARQLLLNR